MAKCLFLVEVVLTRRRFFQHFALIKTFLKLRQVKSLVARWSALVNYRINSKMEHVEHINSHLRKKEFYFAFQRVAKNNVLGMSNDCTFYEFKIFKVIMVKLI